MTRKPNKVISSTREVLVGKVLASLEEEDKVAIMATEHDLILLIRALTHAVGLGKQEQKEMGEFRNGLIQLRKAAFK